MSKYRSLASQLCAIFPYICLSFSDGSFIGFHTVVIAELHRNDSDISASLDQLSWFASLDSLVLLGLIITGLLTHRLGSRPLAITVALSYVSSYLLYYFSTGLAMIFASRALNSLANVISVSGPYISEISEPRLRSSFLAMTQLVTTIGSFFSLLLGSLTSWRTAALINVIFPTLAAVTLLATPYSPIWLASQRRFDEAEKALCWLRGWVEPEQVQTEFCALVKSVETSTTTRKYDIEVASRRQRAKRLLRSFLQRSFYAPFGTMCLVYVLYYLGGMAVIEDYATVVFRELHSPIEESVASAIMGAMSIVGNLIILLVISRVGKRKLVFMSVVVIGVCQAVVAVVGLCELQSGFLWIPPIAVILASFADSLGMGPISYMLVGEIFPTSVRYIGTCMSISIAVILKSTMSKGFLYVVEAITLPGVFLFFASVNLVALFVYYFQIPETEGKSLTEIEDHFKSVTSAKDCEK